MTPWPGSKKPMICRYCSKEIPDESLYCMFCGKKQVRDRSIKKRGNGQGTVIQTAGGKYKAIVTLGYYLDENGKRHRKTRSRVYDKKKDAVAAIPKLLESPREAKKTATFKEVYDLWLPTHKAGKSTLDCYRAAIKYFEPVWGLRISDIDVDDLQECLDDCPHGKRTRENMRAACGLVYKYAIPRHLVPGNLNLAQFLTVSGEGAAARESFSDEQIKLIKKACGKVPHADEIYTMIYTGFRPSEFLALTAADYDKKRQTLTGGAKTDAGRGRSVTLSPKVKAIVDRLAAAGGYLCSDNGNAWPLKKWTEDAFYPALEQIGIQNPLVEIAGGKTRHKYTPHTCRHTFATLMKRVPGADKDKQALIGHASAEMLRYYQDAPVEDLRKITDQI